MITVVVCFAYSFHRTYSRSHWCLVDAISTYTRSTTRDRHLPLTQFIIDNNDFTDNQQVVRKAVFVESRFCRTLQNYCNGLNILFSSPFNCMSQRSQDQMCNAHIMPILVSVGGRTIGEGHAVGEYAAYIVKQNPQAYPRFSSTRPKTCDVIVSNFNFCMHVFVLRMMQVDV